MLQRLQKEQIDGAVHVNTTQMSTPLPRGDGLIWKSIPELTVSVIRKVLSQNLTINSIGN